MPAFTVTAVSTTNDTLTATGVATTGGAAGTVLQTGDRLRLRNVGGALPAATPALAAGTDYFAIRTSDDAIKLSDTNAHALAGTNIIDITGSGSGTTTIEFGLPYCLPTAASAAGTQIKSVDVNGVWAALVALYCLLTGLFQSVWSSLTINVPLTVGGQLYPFADFTFTADSTTDTCTATAHPLHTGAGPIRNSNSGGSAPGGMPDATDWYAINTGANTFKIASSRANAIAGIAIDITSNGSGTQTVNHQATTTRIADCEVTRNLTVDGRLRLQAAGNTVDQAAPAGLAASYGLTWPSGLPAAKSYALIDTTGAISTSAFPIPTPNQFSGMLGVPASGATIIIGGIALNTSTGQNALPLTVLTGAAITAWSVSILKQSTSGTVSAFLQRFAANGSVTQIGSTQSNSANNPGSITLGTTVSQVVAAGEQYAIIVTGGGNAGDSIGAYSLTC